MSLPNGPSLLLSGRIIILKRILPGLSLCNSALICLKSLLSKLMVSDTFDILCKRMESQLDLSSMAFSCRLRCVLSEVSGTDWTLSTGTFAELFSCLGLLQALKNIATGIIYNIDFIGYRIIDSQHRTTQTIPRF